MLVRDSVPRLRVFTSRYVCPTCLSRGYTTQSPPASHSVSSLRARKKRQIDGFGLQGQHNVVHRSFATTGSHQVAGAALAATASPLEYSLITPSGLGFEDPEDVRAYLKNWSRDHQKSIKENAPDMVQKERSVALPNSLFLRNSVDAIGDADNGLSAEVEAADLAASPGSMDDDDVVDDGTQSQRELKPGDILRISSKSGIVRSQLAICLGNRGVQSLYLLSDGRWYASCREIFSSHVVSGLVTPAELSEIEAYLPLRTIEYQKAEDGATMPFAAVGDIPYTHSRHLLQKLDRLSEEVDQAKRDYPAVIEQLYDKVADESEVKYGLLDDFLRDHLHIHRDMITDGVRMHLHYCLYSDERVFGIYAKGIQYLGFLPKKMNNSIIKVTEWARAYQDAAARAAIGKNVSEALNKNPLIPFISKARRLISKSRRIRLPTLEGVLGPTIKEMRPAPGTVERIPNAEEFTEDEKNIIEFLWLTYVKRPESLSAGGRRSKAIASLIIRAVGAYPKFTLDSNAGMLFLKELGCLDPWSVPMNYNLAAPDTHNGLHQAARLAKEKTLAATAALGIQPGQEAPPLPDTMAHLRKDWGDLEVFCIDKKSTMVVDDGISIEPSEEFPDHYWLRVHVAHISAFVAHDSPLLAQAELMGESQYSHIGQDPCIPFDAIKPYSLKANKPVLTFSTLLSPEGSIKDIQITPGIIRNVIRIDLWQLNKEYRCDHIHNVLKVGPVKEGEQQVSEREKERQQKEINLIERHRSTLDLLARLCTLRWDARSREDPNALQMLKLPSIRRYLDIKPLEALCESKYERIFRSEHVVGDLQVSMTCDMTDYNNVTYREQNIKYQPVTGAMVLACESAALWTAARGIPVIYRHNGPGRKTSVSQLNSLGPHDFYIGLSSGESADMRKHAALCMAGYMNVTSPLRRHRDLINHHQIDAYLLAQAGRSEQLDGQSGEIKYPRTRQRITQILKEQGDGQSLQQASRARENQWLMATLYRAFYFQEGKLPEVVDVFINNAVTTGAKSSETDTTSKGTIWSLGIAVTLDPSEEGWEKMAKFRQWLPCKITRVMPGSGLVQCVAVGPPSDKPKGLACPELSGSISERSDFWKSL